MAVRPLPGEHTVILVLYSDIIGGTEVDRDEVSITVTEEQWACANLSGQKLRDCWAEL